MSRCCTHLRNAKFCKMKYVFFFLVSSLVLTSNAQQLKLSGNIKGLPDSTTVYLGALGNTQPDSTFSKNGRFAFNLPVSEGDLYLLQTGKNRRDENAIMLLYLQNGTVAVSGKGPLLKEATLSGSPFIKEYNDFQNKLKADEIIKNSPVVTKQYNDAYQKKDSVTMALLKPELKRLDSVRKLIAQQWFDAHPASPVSSFVLYWYLHRDKSMEELEAALNVLSPEAKANALAKRMQNSIDVSKITAVGKPAPDFTQNDTLGKPVALKDFRGKYVLVDFWASWCVPCRAENPNVVKAFGKYKEKNFTVLSVSLDQPTGKEKWIKAIHDDKLSWTHVSDLKYWDNEVAKQYDIRSIPANLLVDANGKIIAKDLRGEELEKKLQEVLN